jgi:hypothetical protein
MASYGGSFGFRIGISTAELIRFTQYQRTKEEITLSEVERIRL